MKLAIIDEKLRYETNSLIIGAKVQHTVQDVNTNGSHHNTLSQLKTLILTHCHIHSFMFMI